MIRIEYVGPEPKLQGCIIEIPVDPYIRHQFVCSSAKEYIMNTIPDFDSLSLSDDVFNTIPIGEQGGIEELFHWKVKIY